MNDIYFDNAATTRVRPEVAELVKKVMEEDYGNPSSKHLKGMQSEQYLKTAREQISKPSNASRRKSFSLPAVRNQTIWPL